MPETRQDRWPNRRRRLRAQIEGAVLVAGLVVATTMAGGCAGHGTENLDSYRTAVVVAAHDNELGPALGAAERATLLALGRDPDVDGALVHVLAAGRPDVVTVDLEPRRPDGDVEHGGRIDELVGRQVDEVERAVDAAAAQGTATDPLPALDAAGRTDAGRIVLLTAGLGLTGPLDPVAASWDRVPADLVAEATAAGLVPDLSGREVVISGLGRTAGDQEPLGVAEQRWLRELWTALCEAAGATSCRIDDAVRPADPPGSTLVGPVVDVPEPVAPYRGRDGLDVVEVPATLLFGPDSCAVPDPAAATAALEPVLQLLRPATAVVHVSGRTAPVGPGDGRQLSLCRAQRAVQLLLAAGTPASAIGRVTGDGHLQDPPPETNADLAGLRRVVFTVVPATISS